MRQERGGVEGLVDDDGADFGLGIDKIGRLGDVITLASGQAKVAEIAQAIDRRMNLGAHPPAGTDKTLLSLFLKRRLHASARARSC